MRSHADGENTSRKRGKKPEKGEPFIGPIPPDPKTGAPRSHITGSSWIRDMHTGKEYANTWDVQDTGDELQTNVGGHMGTDKFNVKSNSKDVLDHYRKVQDAAKRAAYYERRVFNAVPDPKPVAPKPTKACADCEGTGVIWFGEVKDECSRCNGTGRV